LLTARYSLHGPSLLLWQSGTLSRILVSVGLFNAFCRSATLSRIFFLLIRYTLTDALVVQIQIAHTGTLSRCSSSSYTGTLSRCSSSSSYRSSSSYTGTLSRCSSLLVIRYALTDPSLAPVHSHGVNSSRNSYSSTRRGAHSLVFFFLSAPSRSILLCRHTADHFLGFNRHQADCFFVNDETGCFTG